MADISHSVGGGGKMPGDGTTFNSVADEEHPIGTPMVPSNTKDRHVVAGDASVDTTSKVLGLAMANTYIGNPILLKFAGPVTLSTTEWDAIIAGGSGGGLLRNHTYFLSTTTGKITTTAPTGDGESAIEIGVATSPTDLVVGIVNRNAIGGGG